MKEEGEGENPCLKHYAFQDAISGTIVGPSVGPTRALNMRHMEQVGECVQGSFLNTQSLATKETNPLWSS